MCVILVCETVRPSEEMVGRAWGHNSEGGGVAWIEGMGEEAVVHWKKGLSEQEMKDYCKTLPLPYVAHFRIASVGVKHPTLCHPFPVTYEAETTLAGKLQGAVLFHNGTWAAWRDSVLRAAISANVPVANGPWNDTRAMAYMAAIYGPGVLEFINEKAAVLSPEGADIYGDGWSTENGILVSNRFFLSSGRGYGTSIDIKVTDKRHTAGPGVSADSVPFRGSGPALCCGGDVEESVQEGASNVSAGDGKDGQADAGQIKEVRPAQKIRGIWATATEAATEAKAEREKRLERARQGITFIGEM